MKAAKQSLINREVVVSRLKLINTLESNLAKHIDEYNSAMKGYKVKLVEKLTSAFEKAKVSLEENYQKAKERVNNLTDAEIQEQSDYFNLVPSIMVELKVPRSYAKEYATAIELAKWEHNDTMKLSYSEFVCFVQDEWDWKEDFSSTVNLYK